MLCFIVLFSLVKEMSHYGVSGTTSMINISIVIARAGFKTNLHLNDAISIHKILRSIFMLHHSH